MRPLRLSLCIVRGSAFLLVPAFLLVTGCKGFFVKPCQQTNSCSTGSTGTTGTTGTTTGTTGTTTGTTGTTTGTTGTTTGTTGTTTGTTGTTTGTTGTGSPITPSYLYKKDAATGSIHAYVLRAGHLVPAGTENQLASGANSTSIPAASNGKLLYAAQASGAIYAYQIASDGTLAIANDGAPVADVPGATVLAVDYTGSLLLVGTEKSPELNIFQINTMNGTLRPFSRPQ